MPLKRLVDQVETISAAISFFLNSVLTYLILTKSPKQIGAYKYLMLFISVFEIFYSVIDVIASPIIFSTGSVLVVMSHKKFETLLSTFLWEILVTVYCSFFGLSMGIFALHFIYRYLVTCGSRLLRTFDGYGILMWYLFPLSSGILYGLICHFLFAPTHEITEFIRNDILTSFDWDIDDTVYIGGYFYQKQPDGSITIDTLSFVAIIACSFVVSFSVFAMAYCGVKCYRNINELINTKNMKSTKFNRLQSQLLYALITETLIPVFLMQVPAMILYISTLLNRGLGEISGVISITIALFPAIDPLPTMFIIKDFRNGILEILKKVLCKTRRKSRRSETKETIQVQMTDSQNR